MFRLFAPLLLAFLGMPAFAKYKVCTVTINSKDESEVFKAKLNPADFEFEELTNYASEPEKKSNDWFQRACEAGVQCDVLVVSGHFGGEFFGKSDFKLGLNELNKFSCYNRCAGIMSHPKEVYLFGCNTLATKDKDHRTEQEYVEVLVHDNIDRSEAERRAAARYGPFGSSFKDQIERSFEGVPRIYGFKSVGPAGAHVRGALTSYLSSLGDYKKHLDSINYGDAANAFWAKLLSSYNGAQGRGLSKQNAVYAIKENTCAFTNDEMKMSERLSLAKRLLEKDLFIYLPTISHFIKEKLSYGLGFLGFDDREPAEKELKEIASHRDLSEQVLKTARSSGVGLAIRMDLFRMSQILGWLSPADFDREAREIIAPLLKNATTSSADLLCSLISEEQNMEKYVNESDIAVFDFRSVPQYRILDCVGLKSPEITRHALDGAKQMKLKNPLEMFYVLNVLHSAEGYDDEILSLANRYRGYKGAYAKDLHQFLDRMTVRRATGRDQIEAITRCLTSKEENDLSECYNAIMGNPRYEPESMSKMWHRLIQLNPRQLDHVSLGYLPIPDSEGYQNWLASIWDKMPDKLKYKLGMAILRTDRLRSSALVSKVTRTYTHAVDGMIWEFTPVVNVLAQSPLSAEDLRLLTDALKARSAGDSHFSVPGLRYLLYKQAKAGRIEMTEDLRNGYKSFADCKFHHRGYGCTSTTFTEDAP